MESVSRVDRKVSVFGYVAPPVQRMPRRDALKWVQSLDLSLPLRRIRKDLSNGFLVAEILSRYFPDEIHMHSFENGVSLQCKKANWELICKTLKRRGISIRQELVQGTIEKRYKSAIVHGSLKHRLSHRRVETTP